MNNNNKNEDVSKLTREIWLFEQWLSSIEGQSGETQQRIRKAYEECIAARKAQLQALQTSLGNALKNQVPEPS